MSAALKISTYVVLVIVGGALLAPPLYHLAQLGLDAGLLPEGLRAFAFPKYFTRSVLVVALALLVPFLRWVGVRRWSDLALVPNPHAARDLALGFAKGALGLMAFALVLVGAGHSSLRDPLPLLRLPEAMATAVAVALVEELLFRGALLGVLRRAMSWPRALTFLSLVFAVLHFFRSPPRRAFGGEVHWFSGFEVAPLHLWQFGEPVTVVAGLPALFLVGWTLGYTVVKTRSLWLAIGLHAGWVFALRAFTFTTTRHAAPSVWLGRELTSGIIPSLLVGLTLAILAVLLRRRESEARSRAAGCR